MCFEGVLREFQGHFKDVLRVIQGSFESQKGLQCVHKKMRHSFCLVSGKYILKVGSIAPSSGVQKHFCTKPGSRDINISKWAIIFQSF